MYCRLGNDGGDLCAGVTCTASDACHVAGTCDPATGNCSTPAVTDGTTCDDGNTCTLTDKCQAGVCKGNPITGSVDQSQLVYDGGLDLAPTQVIGQTFTAGKTGLLTGIALITDALGQAGYHVMLGLSGYEPSGEDALIRAVLTAGPMACC